MATPLQMREILTTIRNNRGQATLDQIQLLCSFTELMLPISQIKGGKPCPNCNFRMHNRRLSCPSCSHRLRPSRPYKSAPTIQPTDCLICFRTCTDNRLGCGCLYHENCIVEFCRGEHRTSCPICRQKSALLTEYLSR